MGELIQLLNANAGAGQVIVGMAAVFITIFSVLFAAFAWTEARRTRQRLDEPNVQVILEPSNMATWLFELAVRNVGNVAVYDVRIDVRPRDFPYFGNDETGKPITLGDLNLFKEPIRVLPERQEIRALAFSYMEAANLEPEYHRLAFTASYTPLRGKRRAQTYEYDLDTYLMLADTGRKSLNDVDKRLGTIGKELTKAASNLERLNSRLEWGMMPSPGLSDADYRLPTLLAHFHASWLDFKTLGNAAYSGYNLHHLRMLCEKAHDVLCTYNHADADYVKIRQHLLRIARIRIFGPPTVVEIENLGDEIVTIIERLQRRQGTQPVATADHKMLAHRLLRSVRRLLGLL